MGARAIQRGSGARRAARSCAQHLALAGLLLASPLATAAAEWTVTKTADTNDGVCDTDCSLREAIAALNDLGAVEGEQHRIVFDDALDDDSVITLVSPLEDIEVDVELDASDVLNLSVQGPDSDPDGTTFLRTNTPRVTLIDLEMLGPLGSIIEIGNSDELGFDTSELVEIEVSSDIRDATTRGGRLIKDGLGTLTLSGINTYSGGTFVNAGTLAFTGMPPVFGSIDIAEDSTLEFDTTDAVSLGGRLNGSGTLVKENTNALSIVELTLRGGGAFTGLTEVRGGILRDSSGVIQGNVALGGGETVLPAILMLDVGAGQTRTYDGDITGSGVLSKKGGGTLTLLGDNTYTGTTLLDEGTLIGSSTSIPGPVVANALAETTLVFDQSFAGSFDHPVSVFGGTIGLSVEKRGVGTLTLSSDVDAPVETSVFEGSLIVDGTLTTPTVTAAAGSVLGGGGDGSNSGLITGGNVWVGGTLSPGSVDASGTSQIGTLRVDSIDFQPGSVFEVDVDPTVQSDNLIVNGNASLGSGNILRVVPASGTYTASVTRTILSADSIRGDLSFETDFFRLDIWCGSSTAPSDTCASADRSTLQLTIESNGASWVDDGATTPNQITVAQLLEDEEDGDPTGDLAEVFEALEVIPNEQVQPMLDAIGGEPLSAFPTAQLAIGERFNRVLHRRMRDAAWGKPDALYSFGAAAPAATPAASRRFGAAAPAARDGRQVRPRRSYAGPFRTFEGNTGVGVWLEGWGALGDLEGDGNSADVETRSFGGSFGFDYRLGERLSLGLAGGYANADIELGGRASQGDVDLAQGALYAGWVDPRFHVTASGRYGHAWNDSARRIAFSDIDRTAQASFDSQDHGARAEIGANALRFGPLHVAPLAAFDWAQLRRDDFVESGAISLDLVVEEEEFTSLLGSLGGSLRGTFDLGDDVFMMGELRGFWLHEFGDVERTIRARLSGAVESGSFEIVGAELPRDRILAGVGWSASMGDAVRVLADYDVAIGSGLLQHEITLTVRMHF